jgi:hypothetical protein
MPEFDFPADSQGRFELTGEMDNITCLEEEVYIIYQT